MRALRDFNMPKLVDEDKPIFLTLIDDLFPGLSGTERVSDKQLKQAVIACCKDPLGYQAKPDIKGDTIKSPSTTVKKLEVEKPKRGTGRGTGSLAPVNTPSHPLLYTPGGTGARAIALQPDENFVTKCIELAELLNIRHSVFIIGPPGCGKSEIWKTLVRALNFLGKETVYEVRCLWLGIPSIAFSV